MSRPSAKKPRPSWLPPARTGFDVETDLESLAKAHDRAGRINAVITVSGSDWHLLQKKGSALLSGWIDGHRLHVQSGLPSLRPQRVGGGL